ncbi:MAG TPA: ubiquitin-conjugating enzyme E2, partial [Gemmataceae bacterium]|nr:ubiquitin-conjugating enzyme E2 [Gemmataceae bacterium]
CPRCQAKYRVPAERAGLRARCKRCGTLCVVPASPAAAADDRIVIALPDDTPPPGRPARGRPFVADEDIPTVLPADDIQEVLPATPAAAPGPPTPARVPMRTRRLLADSEQIRQAFQGFAPISVQSLEGHPPDLYRIRYQVRGLERGPNGALAYRQDHLVEIQLTSEYPRQSPKCKMLTPVFHPNIDPMAICVGDHWTAAERLIDLVIRIGEMIAFQAYNLKSPLDGEAAMWTDLNKAHLPLDPRDLHPPNLV